MTTDHTHILKQLDAGALSADDAVRLLRAAPPAGTDDLGALAQRWLRVRVIDLFSGRLKVSVNLPLSWVAAGLKLGTHYAPELSRLDLNEILAALQSGASGHLVDVEDLESGERVEVFVE